MDPQELIVAVQTFAGGDELYHRLQFAIPQLDPAGQDALWAEMKKKSDELYRGSLQLAKVWAGWMLDLSALTGDPRHAALSFMALGNVYSIGAGDYRQGVEYYDQAIAVLTKSGHAVMAAQAQIGRIYALSSIGRVEEALEDGEHAREVLEAHGEALQLTRLLSNMGTLYGRQGKEARALALLDRVLELLGQFGPDAEVIRTRVQVNRALVLRNLGRFDESIQASQESLEYRRKAGQKVEMGRAMQSLAVTYFLQGRYMETLELLEQAREIFWEDDRLRDAMLVELFISDCLLQLRRFPEALEKCQQARELFGARGLVFEMAQTILNEGLAYQGIGRYEEAHRSLQEAADMFEQAGNRAGQVEAYLSQAGILLEQNQTEAGRALAAECQQHFTELDQPILRARACLVQARAALALGQPEQAAELARQALEAGEKLLLPDLTYPSHHLLGQVAISQRQPEVGLAAFEHAIRDLERLCGRLMVEYRAGFVENKGSVYEDAVDLCLTLDVPERGLEFSERAKSRALLDLLAHRLDLSITARSDSDRPLVEELLALRAERDRLYRRREGGEGYGQRGGDGALMQPSAEAGQVLELEKRITELWHRLLVRSADYARQASLWQVRTEPVQPYLRANSRLVEYFAVHGRLVAFVVGEDGVQAVRLSGDLGQVQRQMQLFWLNLRTVARAPLALHAGLVANLQAILNRFHSLLIEPLADRLNGVERLVIVPHGPLHYLPFHALYDGYRYLIERCEVSYLPGASVLRYCREGGSGNGAPANGVERSLLALGHSYGGRLPFVLKEASQVAGLWKGQLLLEEQASLEAFRQAAPGRDILHLAAHGDFRPDNPLFSGLALADGWLTTLDIFNLRLSASLVTLSACQTGRSVVGGGDELLGLMRSFLAAGTASLVSTLWSVEDRSTAEMMQAFYERLACGEEKGAALRQAQLSLLRQPSQEHAHPYFWAPFCLTGDDGPL